MLFTNCQCVTFCYDNLNGLRQASRVIMQQIWSPSTFKSCCLYITKKLEEIHQTHKTGPCHPYPHFLVLALAKPKCKTMHGKASQIWTSFIGMYGRFLKSRAKVYILDSTKNADQIKNILGLPLTELLPSRHEAQTA